LSKDKTKERKETEKKKKKKNQRKIKEKSNPKKENKENKKTKKNYIRECMSYPVARVVSLNLRSLAVLQFASDSLGVGMAHRVRARDGNTHAV
jgi:hypothetical protein